MIDDRMALMEALRKVDDGNFLRNLAETVLQILVEEDLEDLSGIGRDEHDERPLGQSRGSFSNLCADH